jgi:hypothetical protein
MARLSTAISSHQYRKGQAKNGPSKCQARYILRSRTVQAGRNLEDPLIISTLDSIAPIFGQLQGVLSAANNYRCAQNTKLVDEV